MIEAEDDAEEIENLEREIITTPGSIRLPVFPRPIIPPEAWLGMAQNLRAISESATAQFAASFEPVLRAFSDQLGLTRKRLAEVATQIVEMGEMWLRTQPNNWSELGSAVAVHDVYDLMQETGWCLVWCPRSDVLRELLDLDGPDLRTSTLLTRR